MIKQLMQCETCSKTHEMYRDTRILPDGWLVIVERYVEDLHFCSRDCLVSWAGVTLPRPVSGPLEAPASKMRRFLLVDGETAEECEGIVWGSGQVSLDGSSLHCMNYHCDGHFMDWEQFKHGHPGDGVTWIDEIREEVSLCQ